MTEYSTLYIDRRSGTGPRLSTCSQAVEARAGQLVRGWPGEGQGAPRLERDHEARACRPLAPQVHRPPQHALNGGCARRLQGAAAHPHVAGKRLPGGGLAACVQAPTRRGQVWLGVLWRGHEPEVRGARVFEGSGGEERRSGGAAEAPLPLLEFLGVSLARDGPCSGAPP